MQSDGRISQDLTPIIEKGQITKVSGYFWLERSFDFVEVERIFCPSVQVFYASITNLRIVEHRWCPGMHTIYLSIKPGGGGGGVNKLDASRHV